MLKERIPRVGKITFNLIAKEAKEKRKVLSFFF